MAAARDRGGRQEASAGRLDRLATVIQPQHVARGKDVHAAQVVLADTRIRARLDLELRAVPALHERREVRLTNEDDVVGRRRRDAAEEVRLGSIRQP